MLLERLYYTTQATDDVPEAMAYWWIEVFVKKSVEWKEDNHSLSDFSRALPKIWLGFLNAYCNIGQTDSSTSLLEDEILNYTFF